MIKEENIKKLKSNGQIIQTGNSVILWGKVSRIETKQVGQDKKHLTIFSVNYGKNLQWKDGDDKKFKFLYADIECWNDLARQMEAYLKENMQVCILGAKKLETWNDRNSGEEMGKELVSLFGIIPPIQITIQEQPSEQAETTDESTQKDELPF